MCDPIDATSRRFIWGNASNHWVNWNTITQPRKNEGLGVRRARDSNVVMLGKKVWALLHDPDSLWVQLLANKYLKGDSVLKDK